MVGIFRFGPRYIFMDRSMHWNIYFYVWMICKTKIPFQGNFKYVIIIIVDHAGYFFHDAQYLSTALSKIS